MLLNPSHARRTNYSPCQLSKYPSHSDLCLLSHECIYSSTAMECCENNFSTLLFPKTREHDPCAWHEHIYQGFSVYACDNNIGDKLGRTIQLELMSPLSDVARTDTCGRTAVLLMCRCPFQSLYLFVLCVRIFGSHCLLSVLGLVWR